MKTKITKYFTITYALILAAFTVYVLLDTFIIPRSYSSIEDETSVIISERTESDNVNISVKEYRESDTTIYVADITFDNISALKSAFADNTYGKNIKDTTSNIASDNNAMLAINGDFYGAQSDGYVIRNGVLYRSESSGNSQEDFVIYKDGSAAIIEEGDISADALITEGAWQVLSFGPGLINNGSITISENTEVDKAMANNPRTAIGVIDSNHYVFVVADGRTGESTGLSLYELASFMSDTLHVSTAYNLDGGGSSTMYYNGEVINNPTTNGKSIKERKVSDIVYLN